MPENRGNSLTELRTGFEPRPHWTPPASGPARIDRLPPAFGRPARIGFGCRLPARKQKNPSWYIATCEGRPVVRQLGRAHVHPTLEKMRRRRGTTATLRQHCETYTINSSLLYQNPLSRWMGLSHKSALAFQSLLGPFLGNHYLSYERLWITRLNRDSAISSLKKALYLRGRIFLL